LNPRGAKAPQALQANEREITKERLEEYFSLREIEGISKDWIERIRGWLVEYLDYVDWKINKAKTIEFIKHKKDVYAVSTYRKMLFQIRKFLLHLDVEWANNFKAPPELEYKPKRITKEDISRTLHFFKDSPYYLQLKAIVLLGASSGLRSEELCQLSPQDLDLENRIVYVNHNPDNGQTTKTKKSRISFFSEEAKKALEEYLRFFNNGSDLKKLFERTHILKAFKRAPISLKDLRKFFSQEWERRNGSYAVKELLMGYSLKKSVDLQHYTYLDEEDLKKIYDKVGIRIGLGH